MKKGKKHKSVKKNRGLRYYFEHNIFSLVILGTVVGVVGLILLSIVVNTAYNSQEDEWWLPSTIMKSDTTMKNQKMNNNPNYKTPTKTKTPPNY